MLQFQCPSCKTPCEAAPEFAGKLVVCPSCGQSVSVPKDVTAITEEAPPPPVPQRESVPADDRWPGRSIAKDGGATGVFLRNGVVVAIIFAVVGTFVCLLLPATRRVQDGGTRMQSTNNLKQIALVCQSFHDANKRLPFNGSDVSPANRPEVKYTKEAVGGSFTSGSWAFQILSYIDQAPLFAKPDVRNHGLSCYMCPGRGRPMFEVGGGAWTDYFYNNYMNDPLQAAKPDAADAKRTLLGITDGSSNTIIAGQGNIDTTQYSFRVNVVGSSNIFLGGTIGTTRSGDSGKTNPTGAILARDSAQNPGIGSWGGPFAQGLMAMADGTVRMFPYGMQNFSAFLTTTGDEDVVLPDT